MRQDVELGCRCGAIHGRVKGVAPETVNRTLCYCDDCQAFLFYLGRAELMDSQGGTDIVQVAPAMVSFDRGTENIVGLRLAPKGLHRWYARCCKTPLGNTRPPLPFVGIPPEAFRSAADAGRRDELFGKVRGAAFGKFAKGGPPEGSTQLPLKLIAHSARLLLGWQLSGQAWPHPFFERHPRAERYPVTTLSAEERNALRSQCGPGPVASPAA